MSGAARVSLRAFNVVVVPRHEWPWARVGASMREEAIPLDITLVTTQTHVYRDIVDSLVEALRRGDHLARIETMRVGGRLWIIDGHHRLVAYRALGYAVPSVRYGPGHDTPRPPKLFARRRV
ncbi:MAG: hypothetical protein Q8S13_11655 [Dehalococcoidia bacterium]|nr:hypothetical protein [Dehalococcoidia bacterium]